jgi:hypothetical protein
MENPINAIQPPDSGAAFSGHLDQEQVVMIEEALESVGEYGEVRLIVEKGRLRFLVTQKSYDALKLKPGHIARQPNGPAGSRVGRA